MIRKICFFSKESYMCVHLQITMWRHSFQVQSHFRHLKVDPQYQRLGCKPMGHPKFNLLRWFFGHLYVCLFMCIPLISNWTLEANTGPNSPYCLIPILGMFIIPVLQLKTFDFVTLNFTMYQLECIISENKTLYIMSFYLPQNLIQILQCKCSINMCWFVDFWMILGRF